MLVCCSIVKLLIVFEVSAQREHTIVGEFMEPGALYQNVHYQLTEVIGSQQGETCWPNEQH